MRELLQSVGDAAQMRLRYSSFSLHLMKGKIDEPSRALRYSNAQAHNTKVPGDVAHRTHCVRTTQPPLLNRSSTLHILLPYNGSDIASYIAFDGRGMRDEYKELEENLQRMQFEGFHLPAEAQELRDGDGLSTSYTYMSEDLRYVAILCGVYP